MLDKGITEFLREDAYQRFVRYVKIDTRSGINPEQILSSPGQWDLAKLLTQELQDLGLQNVELDEWGYVYAVLPASPQATGVPISFLAHMDTSPDEPGDQVVPLLRKNYDGGGLLFPDNPGLKLDPTDSPALLSYLGEDIITASGSTLLGADDKAGIAEIMASLAAFIQFPQLLHPEIRICFTPDEEVGSGTAKINLSKLGKVAYTLDGGEMGELEDECFDAHSAKVVFHGRNVHPGYAKGMMINAAAIATRFAAALPEQESPENTKERDGFFHLAEMKGDETEATLFYILRDFEVAKNQRRIDLLQLMKQQFELRYPGLSMELIIKDSYKNMKEILVTYPEVIAKAETALRMAELPVLRTSIRGGTDGARLCFMGLPTPNLFAGGNLFHSKREWIPVRALQKAAEVVIYLSDLWVD